jgi:hypothetical protein
MSIMWRKDEEITFERVVAGIGYPRTFEYQCLLTTEGANPPKREFFDVVAHLEAGMAQFSNALDQRS